MLLLLEGEGDGGDLLQLALPLPLPPPPLTSNCDVWALSSRAFQKSEDDRLLPPIMPDGSALIVTHADKSMSKDSSLMLDIESKLFILNNEESISSLGCLLGVDEETGLDCVADAPLDEVDEIVGEHWIIVVVDALPPTPPIILGGNLLSFILPIFMSQKIRGYAVFPGYLFNALFETHIDLTID